MRCPICTVRVGPCLDDDGAAMPQYHLARVMADARRRVDHAAEAARLRAAQKESGR